MPSSTLFHSSVVREACPRPAKLQNSPAGELIADLIHSSLLLAEDWNNLPPDQRAEFERSDDVDILLDLLAAEGLITPYQVDRIRAGTTAGLILGNYRLLQRLGAGGMG